MANGHDLFPAIRIPILLILQVEIPMHMFRLTELVESLLAKFARATGVLHPTKWTGVMIREWIVDPDRPGFYVIEELFDLLNENQEE